jgi:glycosyltransferase involved in cell wall biosynthesis
VASYNARETITRTLRSLAAQHGGTPFEVIVVDSSGDDTAGVVARDFPSVRLLRHAERRFAGEARNLGAVEARGRIFALLDADCIVAADWIEQVVRSHALAYEVIGGVVENGNPASYVGWAYYFTEFGHWLPGMRAGLVDEVPGCSMTIKRSAYDRYGPFMSGAYCSDTQFMWRMAAADGTRPYLDPAIRVSHLNPERLTTLLRHQPQHGRDFARLRSREQLTRASALLRAALALFLPPLLFLRAAGRVHRHSRYRLRFVAAAPLTFAAMTAWSCGELRGYLESAFAPLRRTTAQ